MIHVDYLKCGKGLLLAGLVPVMLLMLHICAFSPGVKCWAFQLAVAIGVSLMLAVQCNKLRLLIIASFVFKFALLESLDEAAGNMPLVSLAFSFVLL